MPWKGCKPNSVCLGRSRGRGSFISAASTRDLSANRSWRGWSGPLRGPLFGLAPDGVFRAPAITLGAVGSYPTISPLPEGRKELGSGRLWGGIFSVALSVDQALGPSRPRIRRLTPHWSGIATGLRGIVPYGVRTFLPPRRSGRSDPPPFQGRVEPTLGWSQTQPGTPDYSAITRFMSRV